MATLEERYENDILTDNRGRERCEQCADCLMWDTGESWAAPNKTTCVMYEIKPLEVIDGTAECPYKVTANG